MAISVTHIICPFCHDANNQPWEQFGDPKEDGDIVCLKCDKCKKDFLVTLEITTTYISSKKKES